MAYANLMVHLELNGQNDAVLAVAADLAARFDARVIGIAACQPLQILYTEGATSADLLTRDREEIVRELAATEAQFHTALQGRARSLQWREAITYAPLCDYLADEARAADLIITGRDLGASLMDETRRVAIGSLAMRAGRPLLIVPRNVRSLTLRNVFVGWRESRESRRAVADALPLLRLAGRATVLEIVPQPALAMAQARLEDVAGWLATHGVTAVPQALARVGDEIGHLRAELMDRRCDLFVAGAYGHSRLGEWAFGGVTQDMLLDPDCCTLLSH